jgi:HSP20 family protein
MSPRQLAYLLGRNGFEKPMNRPATPTQPAVNIAETAESFRIEVAAPGLAKEDFEISLNERNVLTISGKKETAPTDTTETIHRREFAVRSFEHSFKLPEQADTQEPTAAYNQGILTIEIKKKTKNVQAVKTIQVN